MSGVSLTSGIVCIDSLQMFRQLYYETEDFPETSTIDVSDCLSLYTEATNEQDDERYVLPQKIHDAKKLNETTPKKQIVERFLSIPNPAKKIKLSPKKNFNFG